MTRAALEALLERVKAEGPDREIDAALLVALLKPEQFADDLRYYRLPSPSMDHMEMCAPGTYWLKQRSGASLHTSPHYTASLDASLVLVERVLPDIKWSIARFPENQDRKALYTANLTDIDGMNAKLVGHALAPTPALALLAALLKAKIAEGA